MIRVLVTDDEPLIREGLAAILGPEPDLEVVAAASDGAEAVGLVREHQPDVVLMDLRMPRVDGIEATRTITSRWPARPKVLVLTTFDEDEYVAGALAAGASGFLLKRSSSDELAHAIRTVHAGESLLFPERLRAMMRAGAAAPDRHPGFARLTEREAQVLRLLTTGATNADVAQRLSVSVQTVKTHVAAVLAKLEVRDRTQAVVRAYQERYVEP